MQLKSHGQDIGTKKSENRLTAVSPTLWCLTSTLSSSTSYRFCMRHFCLRRIPGTGALIPEMSRRCCVTLYSQPSFPQEDCCGRFPSLGFGGQVSAVLCLITHSPKLKHEGMNQSSYPDEASQFQNIY